MLVQKQQDRRDQGAGMSDPDPPNEISYREAPCHRNIDAPNADPEIQKFSDRVHEQHHEEKENPKPRNQRIGNLGDQDDGRYLFANAGIRVIADDNAAFHAHFSPTRLSFDLDCVF